MTSRFVDRVLRCFDSWLTLFPLSIYLMTLQTTPFSSVRHAIADTGLLHLAYQNELVIPS